MKKRLKYIYHEPDFNGLITKVSKDKISLVVDFEEVQRNVIYPIFVVPNQYREMLLPNGVVTVRLNVEFSVRNGRRQIEGAWLNVRPVSCLDKAQKIEEKIKRLKLWK